MLKKFKTDLHIHTCLSPCADLDMSPEKIVRIAGEKKLDIIAICDHNSAENVKYVQRASRNTQLTVLAGIEITSSEEVHTLGIFRELDAVLQMQQIVYEHLNPGINNPDLFGDQVIANEFDEVEGFCERLLIGATTLPVKEIYNYIHRFNGLAIASHIDRESYSLIGQLGFIPEDLEPDALEITGREKIKEYNTYLPGNREIPFITSSDAHFIDDIGSKYTEFIIEKPTTAELKLALNGKMNRKVVLK